MNTINQDKGPSRKKGWLWLLGAALGILWSFLTVKMLGGFLTLIGVFFVIFAVMKAVYHFQNAPKNSFVQDEEKPVGQREKAGLPDGSPLLCPVCGAQAEKGDAFCRRCGKKLSL